MKAFIKTILGYDPKDNSLDGGILSVVKAYYGCVEAQGRGTLHCHMLVWLEGRLNPNQIKEKALKDGGDLEFQKRLIDFLEDTISNSVLPDPDPSFNTELGEFNSCATRGPMLGDNAHDPILSQAKDIHKLVKRCQTHTHHSMCYKYWHGPPEPKECRFDLDESNVVPVSVFDPDTGEFTLRCLDGPLTPFCNNGLVNNFNDTMIEAIWCNMDNKFIGSGAAAKAILYYITDYITKTQLQAHIAYAALELAVGRLGEYDPEEDDRMTRAKRLLQKCAHSMIAKQELSAQRVVSYLMDFEDHFTSHKYNNLYWTGFEKFINDEDPSPECYQKYVDMPIPDSADTMLPDANLNEDLNEDEITLVFGPTGRVQPSANQISDYQNCGCLLDQFSVWDFAARIEKVSKASTNTIIMV
ncbi:hypothetical protein B0H10DRAFT_2361763 [Mycena sp. CBHHK59/15]|nr:hypothetical protein B0H10DRAFT_2361763 [Mycena sp. CBHHK59/15]